MDRSGGIRLVRAITGWEAEEASNTLPGTAFTLVVGLTRGMFVLLQ